VLRLKEAGHDERRAPLVEHLMRDVRHMMPRSARSPAFAAAVILTLGVGIGGNTAIFSVVDQVLLRPLPYPTGISSSSCSSDSTAADLTRGRAQRAVQLRVAGNWLDWQRDNGTLTDIAVWRNLP
jgi:hypothetical protein